MSKTALVTSSPAAVLAVVTRVDDLLAIWHLDLERAPAAAIQPLRDVVAAAIRDEAVAPLAEALERPASAREVAVAMKELLESFPPRKEADMRKFSSNLGTDVMAAQPSMAVLLGACKALRAACTFTPAIAEVLEAIEAQRVIVRTKVEMLRRLGRRVAEADEILGEGQAPP